MIGKTISHYQITEKIGEGGMGEVYRARDTKLNRDVALKILPQIFAQDAQRMARFEREAQVLASLNHSHIAQIHELEEAEGTKALVLELVEGETLQEQIARGPIPVDEALKIALQICEGLEAAHEKGIIHRDLKPANIKITPEGEVKILDFGLAKALEGETPASDLSHSPTITHAATEAGVILGTASYMSPEQARGKPVDKRADIWAFGCVLFEMLAGRGAFDGEDTSEILASVIRGEVVWEALPEGLRVPVTKLLRRCLTKDLRDRLQAIGEARFAINEFLSASPQEEHLRISSGKTSFFQVYRTLPWILAVISCAALFAIWLNWQDPPARLPRQLSIDLGAEVNLATIPAGSPLALSPDGSLLAFLGQGEKDREQEIYIRRLDRLEATRLSGTTGAQQICFSPDGEWIAFGAEGELKKIPVGGGVPVPLCDLSARSRGISWGDDDSIVFVAGIRDAVLRIPAAGGVPQPVTALDSRQVSGAELDEGTATHRWPQLLPGSRVVLFTQKASTLYYDDAQIVAHNLDRGERKLILEGGYYGRYLSSGHIVYLHRGTLFGVAFDLEKLKIRGQPTPLLEGILSMVNMGAAKFSISERGDLVYVRDTAADEFQLEWLEEDGSRRPLPLEPARIGHFQFSPSGRLLAVEIRDAKQSDIWIYDVERDVLSRLTFHEEDDLYPVWSPSGETVIFSSMRDGGSNLYWKLANGSGDPRRLTETDRRQIPYSWHPSGKYLALTEYGVGRSGDLRILSMEGDDQSGWIAGKTEDFLSTPFNESNPQFSPDGDWVAYTYSESGLPEVFVRAFPRTDGQWQISNGAGVWPQWSFGGGQLLYGGLGSGHMYRAAYRTETGSFVVDRSERWETGDFHQLGNVRSHTPHPDGKRLLLRKAVGGESRGVGVRQVVLFQGFSEYLKERMPTE